MVFVKPSTSFSDDNEFKKVESAKNGDAYVYTLEDNGSEIKIKAYIPWQNKTNLKVIYTLKDATIKGVDTGEISFNLQFRYKTN